MKRPLKKIPSFLFFLAFPLLSALLGGCGVSEDMVLLPRPKGLVPLTRLESHLNYQDPFDSRDSYVLPGGGGR